MALSLRERLELAAKNSDFATDNTQTADNEQEEAFQSEEDQDEEDVVEEQEASGNQRTEPVGDIRAVVNKVLLINELLSTYDEQTVQCLQDTLKQNDKAGLITCIISIDSSYADNILKFKQLFSLRGSTDLAFAVIEMPDIKDIAKLVEGYNPEYHYNADTNVIIAKKALTKAIETLDEHTLDKMVPLLELLEISRS